MEGLREVEKLKRDMLETGILFLDKKILKRITELRGYFSEEIISHVEDRISDPRTNAEIQRILDDIISEAA